MPSTLMSAAACRMRRMMLGMSQEKLAAGLGLTFQQVQKYEKGVNRMGSSRLQNAADILGVAVPFFFEGVTGGTFTPDGNTPSPAYIDDFVSSEEGSRVMKAFKTVREAECAETEQLRVLRLANEAVGKKR